MVAGAVVGQVTGRALSVTGAEPLVVPLDQATGVVDHVQAVVRSVRCAEPVGRADDEPEAQAARKVGHLGGGVSQVVPVEVLEAVEIGARVPR